MNETQLIEGCKQHNPKAQKALYDTYARKMMSVCLRYGSNRETAEDLLQEGFIKVFSAIGSFEGSGYCRYKSPVFLVQRICCTTYRIWKKVYHYRQSKCDYI